MNASRAAVMIGLGACLAAARPSHCEVDVEKVSHAGWENCYRVTNGRIEAIVTSDVGPRVISFGRAGGPNEFHEFADQVGKTGGENWRIYGGHRLWHAPEVRPRTYAPDNDPVDVRREGDLVRCIQPVEKSTGIQKEIALAMDPAGPRVRVVHRLTNRNAWPVELAPWAVSVMAPGGCAILPLPTAAPNGALQPNARIALWPYTNMADPRFLWGQKHIVVRQDAQATSPAKIGIMAPDGWGAYCNDGRLFVKTFRYDPRGTYPDMGSSLEAYTAAGFLELETLAPLTRLAPGQSVVHMETWHWLGGVKFKPDPEAVETTILPLVKPLLESMR